MLSEPQAMLTILTSMSPEQCRAARSWLNMSIADLADASNVSIEDIGSFESKGMSPLPDPAVAAVRSALQQRGVLFVDEVGIFVLEPDTK
jgi:DNA-binding transcriptional regulator YiaG